MNSSFYVGVSFFLMFLSQIIRVRCFNILISPHFSIGLRSGILMNAICSFLNILTPLRLGDLYRFFFLKRRYGASPAIFIPAILIERSVDTVFLIVLLYSTTYVASPSLILWQIIFLIFAVLSIFLVFILNARDFHVKIFSLSISRVDANRMAAQFLYLARNQVAQVFAFSSLNWLCYTGAGFFVVKSQGYDFQSWIKWNLDVSRAYDFTANDFNLFGFFNSVFILAFGLAGLLIGLLNHTSNFLINFLSGTTSDRFLGDSRTNIKVNTKRRKFLLLSPSELYIKQNSITLKNSFVYAGGSGALVYSKSDSSEFIHKVAFGQQAARLEQQYNYIGSLAGVWNFPTMYDPIKRRDYFAYSMNRIEEGIPLNIYLNSLDTESSLRSILDETHRVIEEGNRSIGNVSSRDILQNLDALWATKIESVIRDLKVQLPHFFGKEKIFVNGIEHLNLGIMSERIRSLLQYLNIPNHSSASHGDATLSNILFSTSSSTIYAIDPNPNHQFKNVVIDHGKVLQSLWAEYENLRENASLIESRPGSIVFAVPENYTLAKSFHYYSKILQSSEILAASKVMCFASMIRLMPYRVQLDYTNSSIFMARTLQIGSEILRGGDY
jgi:hypothetical protein